MQDYSARLQCHTQWTPHTRISTLPTANVLQASWPSRSTCFLPLSLSLSWLKFRYNFHRDFHNEFPHYNFQAPNFGRSSASVERRATTENSKRFHETPSDSERLVENSESDSHRSAPLWRMCTRPANCTRQVKTRRFQYFSDNFAKQIHFSPGLFAVWITGNEKLKLPRLACEWCAFGSSKRYRCGHSADRLHLRTIFVCSDHPR